MWNGGLYYLGWGYDWLGWICKFGFVFSLLVRVLFDSSVILCCCAMISHSLSLLLPSFDVFSQENLTPARQEFCPASGNLPPPPTPAPTMNTPAPTRMPPMPTTKPPIATPRPTTKTP